MSSLVVRFSLPGNDGRKQPFSRDRGPVYLGTSCSDFSFYPESCATTPIALLSPGRPMQDDAGRASLPLSDSPRYPFLGVKQPRSRLKTKRTQATACGCEVRRAYRMSQARDVRKKRQISLISGENCLGLPRINPRWESCHFRPRTVKEKGDRGWVASSRTTSRCRGTHLKTPPNACQLKIESEIPFYPANSLSLAQPRIDMIALFCPLI